MHLVHSSRQSLGLCDMVGAASVMHNMVKLERSAMDLIKWNFYSDRFQRPGSPFITVMAAQEAVDATLGEPGGRHPRANQGSSVHIPRTQETG